MNKKTILLAVILIAAAVTIIFAALGSVSDDGQRRSIFNINFPGKLETHDVNETKSFNANEIDDIKVKTISTNITTVTGLSSEIKVVYSGTVSVENSDLIPELVTEIRNGTLVVEINYPDSSIFSFGSRYSSKTDLEIHLPENFNGEYDAATVSGNIDIDENVYEKLILKTVSGNIALDNIVSRETNANTTSGNIRVDGEIDTFSYSSISGTLRSNRLETEDTAINTTSGKADIEGFTGELYFKSISGDISVEFESFDASVEITTTSGEAELYLPYDAVFEIDFKSTSGDIDIDFELDKIDTKSDHKLKGAMDNGDKLIYIRTLSGDIEIRK